MPIEPAPLGDGNRPRLFADHHHDGIGIKAKADGSAMAAADGSVRPVSTRSVTRNAEVESGEAASFTYTPPTDPNGTTLGEFVSVKVNYVLEQTATPSPRVDVRLVPQPGITLDLSVGGASTVAFPIVSRGLAGGTPGM